MSNKDIAHHITHYRNVFVYLLIGTALTVAASYLEFNVKDSIAGAIFIGLLIASIKGYLVAANFMHLNSEKKMIYWILMLTVFFLVLLLSIPLLWDINNMSNY
jgi:caa(3)-type oxidase subunit IV